MPPVTWHPRSQGCKLKLQSSTAQQFRQSQEGVNGIHFFKSVVHRKKVKRKRNVIFTSVFHT